MSAAKSKSKPAKKFNIGYYGWMPDLPDHRDRQFAAPLLKLGPLPAKVDLRKQCPGVYNQGQIGSCTANAIAGAIEFDRLKQKLPDFIPSRLFIYYNERAMENTVATDSGAQIRDGVKSGPRASASRSARIEGQRAVGSQARPRRTIRCNQRGARPRGVSWILPSRIAKLSEASSPA